MCEEHSSWKEEWKKGIYNFGEVSMQQWDGTREKAQRLGEHKIVSEVSPELGAFINLRHAVYVASVNRETGAVWTSAIFADPTEQLRCEAAESELGTIPQIAVTPQPQERAEDARPFCDTCGVQNAGSNIVSQFQATAYQKLIRSTASEVRVLKPPTPGDPLWENAACPGEPISLNFVEFETRRRCRVNGIVSEPISERGFAVTSIEAFSTCPRYIQQRTIDGIIPNQGPPKRTPSTSPLPGSLVDMIARSDTFMVSTFHSAGGIGGADCSHRGGRPGFVRVIGNTKLVWGDYHGKGMFQTLGNTLLNPRVGLLFIDFQHGATLQLTGQLETLWLGTACSIDDTDRLCVFTLDEWSITENASPFHWKLLELSSHSPLLHDTDVLRRVACLQPIVSMADPLRTEGEKNVVGFTVERSWEETPSVRTFRLATDRAIVSRPGQYSTFVFNIDGKNYIRCWTHSSGHSSLRRAVEPCNAIEISVKKIGFVTQWLHSTHDSEIKGKVLGIEGSFTLQTSASILRGQGGVGPASAWWRILFLSGGVGVTPMMSMLRGLQDDLNRGYVGRDDVPDICVVHSEKSWDEVPFKKDWASFLGCNLVSSLSFALTQQVAAPETPISRAKVVPARLNAGTLKELVPDISTRIAYLCGPPPMMYAMTSALTSLGVPQTRVLVENYEY